jgi:hypothetical protein
LQEFRPDPSGEPSLTFAERQEWLLEQARAELVGPGRWRERDDRPQLANLTANDLGKHWWPRIFAELAIASDGTSVIDGAGAGDQPPPETRAIIEGLVHNRPMEAFTDDPNVGYLYFSPVGLGWLVQRHADLLTDADLETLLTAVFDYPATQASLNLFTGEGTENHVLMGRVGGYLVSAAVVERADQPIYRRFADQAEFRLQQTRDYLWETLVTLYDIGTGEYDSSTYYPYVLSAWLAVYETAPEEDVREWSRAVLDWFAATVALRWDRGVFGGYEQRGGAATSVWNSNLDPFAWLWFGAPGTPDLNGRDWSQMVYAALSDYQPPEAVIELAHKQLPEGVEALTVFESEPSYLVHGADVVRSETKGLFYYTQAFNLGTTLARPIGGFTGGGSQDVLWKLTAFRPENQEAVVFTSPTGRDPWRQLAQWEGVLVDLVWHPDNARALANEGLERVRAWREAYGRDAELRFPEDTAHPNTVTSRKVETRKIGTRLSFPEHLVQAVVTQGKREPIVFVAAGSAFVAIRSLDGDAPKITQRNGVYTVEVTAARGGFNGLILEAVPVEDFPDFQTFMERILSAGPDHTFDADRGRVSYLSLAGDRLDVAYQTAGSWTEPQYDWGYGWTTYGGVPIPAMPPARFPDWPSGEGEGRVPSIAVNGRTINLDTDWPTYSSEVIASGGGTLRLQTATEALQITIDDGEVIRGTSTKMPALLNPFR